MPKTPCYLDGKIASLCGTGQNGDKGLKIFIYLEPYEPLSVWKFENTQNKNHPKVRMLHQILCTYTLAQKLVTYTESVGPQTTKNAKTKRLKSEGRG